MKSRLASTFWSIVDWPFKAVSYVLIQGYRYSLSMFMGRNCRHAPTCSEFTRDAIWTHGFWPGGIYRCRPGGPHGFDPVPETPPANARWYTPWRYGRWT